VLRFDQCCFCEANKYPGTKKKFWRRPEPEDIPPHMKVQRTKAGLVCGSCFMKMRRPPSKCAAASSATSEGVTADADQSTSVATSTPCRPSTRATPSSSARADAHMPIEDARMPLDAAEKADHNPVGRPCDSCDFCKSRRKRCDGSNEGCAKNTEGASGEEPSTPPTSTPTGSTPPTSDEAEPKCKRRREPLDVPTANAENRRAQEELKRLHERIEAAEKKLKKKEFSKRDLYFLQRYRDYAEIIDAAGVDDFIPHIFDALISGKIPPDHIWIEFNYWAWRNANHEPHGHRWAKSGDKASHRMHDFFSAMDKLPSAGAAMDLMRVNLAARAHPQITTNCAGSMP